MTAGVQHILVTGSSRGLGREIAEHYLRAGLHVAGCARSPATIEHERHLHCVADVSDPAAVARVVATIRERWGALDAVVNNAGQAKMLPVALTPPDTARRIMEVNYLGTFAVVHEALRLLRRSPCARIVNLSTIAAPLALPGEAAYAASKAAVEMLTRVVAHEVGPLGITCNAIGPSPIRTDLVAGVPQAKLDALVARQAIPRWATAEDVIHVLDFLLHPGSGQITGQVLYLGGFS